MRCKRCCEEDERGRAKRPILILKRSEIREKNPQKNRNQLRESFFRASSRGVRVGGGRERNLVIHKERKSWGGGKPFATANDFGDGRDGGI